jgi:hypothetical protein
MAISISPEDIHISKRGLNETGNQTDTGMEDWAAILRMQ